jgi:hypothetical protein
MYICGVEPHLQYYHRFTSPGLVRLVCLVRLPGNLRFFLRQQMDKHQTSGCPYEQTVNRLRKITWASVLLFNSMCFHVSMFMSPCPGLHVSMSPFLHVSMSPCLCLNVSMSPSWCLHVHFPRSLEFWKRKTATICFLQMENGNGNLPFICCKWKRKTDVCFPWSVNDKRQSTGKKHDHLCIISWGNL